MEYMVQPLHVHFYSAGPEVYTSETKSFFRTKQKNNFVVIILLKLMFLISGRRQGIVNLCSYRLRRRVSRNEK